MLSLIRINFTEAFVQCKNILNQKNLSDELKGKCYNLLGMYEILQNNDTRTALQWFKKALESYDKAKLPRRIAGIEVNIANIYNLLGEFSKAEEHWANASEINNSVGNLEQEGLLLLNVGVHHHHKRNTEKSIQLVNRAYKIFLSLGNEISESLALLNLGEMHMYISEYQKSYDSLSQAEMILKRHNHPEELAELYLIRGKFFFKVGDAETLTKIKDEFSNHLLANTLPQKQLNNLNYLEQLEAIINNNDVNIDQFKTVVKNYFEGNEKFNFSESFFILTEYLTSSDQYDEALNLITMKEIIEICKQSIIFEAEREYFLGKISLVLGSDKLLPPIDHFENAYKLIQEESITELTWKVLWALAESYRQRGNEQKTKNYTNYAKELIQFIADQISNMELRNIYLQKEERKTVLQN